MGTILTRWIGDEMLVMSHGGIGGCWPDGHHWLASIYAESKTYHYWTGDRKLKAWRNVYLPSGCRNISLVGFVLSGVFAGLPLMGPGGGEYHRRINAIDNVVSKLHRPPLGPLVIDLVRIYPKAYHSCEWVVDKRELGTIEDPIINGLEFSFKVMKHWSPDPIALKSYYVTEQLRKRRNKVIRASASFLRDAAKSFRQLLGG